MKKIYEVWVIHDKKGSTVTGPEKPPDGHYFLVPKQEMDQILDKCLNALKDIGSLVNACTPEELGIQIPEELHIRDETYWRENIYLSEEEGVVHIRFITIDKAHKEGVI